MQVRIQYETVARMNATVLCLCAAECPWPILQQLEFGSLPRLARCGTLGRRFCRGLFGSHGLHFLALVRSILFLSLFMIRHALHSFCKLGASSLPLRAEATSIFQEKFFRFVNFLTAPKP